NEEAVHYFHDEKEVRQFHQDTFDLNLFDAELDQEFLPLGEAPASANCSRRRGKLVELQESAAIQKLIAELARQGLKVDHYAERKKRNFPKHMLEEALVVAQKITDEAAGKPFKRLLLADALGIKPASSNFAYLLSSSIRYQLTEGSEKASEITLTATGVNATQTEAAQRRLGTLRT